MSEESSTLGTTLHFVSSTGFRHPSSDTHTHTRPNRPRAIYSYVHPLSDTAGGGTRTLNHPLTGRVLFRLSYAGTIGRGPVRYLPATMDTTSDPTDYLARPSSQPEQRALPCNLTATLCAGLAPGRTFPLSCRYPARTIWGGGCGSTAAHAKRLRNPGKPAPLHVSSQPASFLSVPNKKPCGPSRGRRVLETSALEQPYGPLQSNAIPLPRDHTIVVACVVHDRVCDWRYPSCLSE